MTKKILVTGSRGFIGIALTEYLRKKGYQVIGTHRPSQKGRADEILLEPFKKIELAKHDDVEGVIHLAGKYLIGGNLEDTAKMYESNIGLTSSVLELVKVHKMPIVAAGTFFEKSNEIKTKLDSYVLTKSNARKILKHETLISNTKVGILFLYDNYSTNLTRGKFLDQVLKASMTGERIKASSGNQVIDLMHILDVCESFEMALEALVKNDTNYLEMQARSYRVLTLREVASLVENRIGREIVDWGVVPDRSNSIFSLWDSAPDVPNFQSKIKLEVFIKETLDGK
jgi:nucleoside-diphosphate-sugar epimerase